MNPRLNSYHDEEIEVLLSLIPNYLRKSSGTIAWQQLSVEFNRLMSVKYPTLYTERNKHSLHGKFNYLVKHQSKKSYESQSVNPLIAQALNLSRLIQQRRSGRDDSGEDDEEEQEVRDDDLQSEEAEENDEGHEDGEDESHGKKRRNGEQHQEDQENESGMDDEDEDSLFDPAITTVQYPLTTIPSDDVTSSSSRYLSAPALSSLPEDQPSKKRLKTGHMSSRQAPSIQSRADPNASAIGLEGGFDEQHRSSQWFQHLCGFFLQLRREDLEREDRRRKEDYEREAIRRREEDARFFQLIRLLAPNLPETSLPTLSVPTSSSPLFPSSEELEEFRRWKEQQMGDKPS